MFRKMMFIAVLAVPSMVLAQTSGSINVGNNGSLSGGTATPPFSSTGYEGALRGWGMFLGGMGDYLVSLGAYENLHEEARRKAMDNWAYGIRNRRVMKEEYWAHYRLSHPDFITRETIRLDNLERLAELKQRRKDVEERIGIQHKTPVFGWRGHQFSSYAEFKASPVYQDFLRARDLKQSDRAILGRSDALRRQAAVDFLRLKRFPPPVE